MFSSVCPSCGAPVSFRSTASATAICNFCKSTLVRDADTLKRIGKQGELFNDASPIQIGTGGNYDKAKFTVIGRIQLQYDGGYWNEWFILFDDGQTGWMSEASGIYAIMLEAGEENIQPLPEFDNLLVGQTLRINGQALTATDKRTAQCVAAEGELPFPLTDRWQARTVDFQRDNTLATLDYSEPKTALFLGRTVGIDSLKFSLLKSLAPNTLGAASIGSISAKSIKSLACASCGASIKIVPSLTPEIICPQCNSKQAFIAGALKNSSIAAQAAVAEASKPDTALNPGDKGTFNGTRWTVLGVVVRHTLQDTSDHWEEYLLYDRAKQFAWLIFANYQWQFGEVLATHPTLSGKVATLEGTNLFYRDSYTAKTSYAAGSFNWKVKVGDVCNVSEYKGDGITLSRESTAEEVTWTKSTAVNGLDLLKSFGHEPTANQSRNFTNDNSGKNTLAAKIKHKDLALIFSAILVLITGPAWIAAGINDPSTAIIIGLFALWLPLGYFND
jgi:Domain of unknown function (DUF4178)